MERFMNYQTLWNDSLNEEPTAANLNDFPVAPEVIAIWDILNDQEKEKFLTEIDNLIFANQPIHERNILVWSLHRRRSQANRLLIYQRMNEARAAQIMIDEAPNPIVENLEIELQEIAAPPLQVQEPDPVINPAVNLPNQAQNILLALQMLLQNANPAALAVPANPVPPIINPIEQVAQAIPQRANPIVPAPIVEPQPNVMVNVPARAAQPTPNNEFTRNHPDECPDSINKRLKEFTFPQFVSNDVDHDFIDITNFLIYFEEICINNGILSSKAKCQATINKCGQYIGKKISSLNYERGNFFRAVQIKVSKTHSKLRITSNRKTLEGKTNEEAGISKIATTVVAVTTHRYNFVKC